jgi:hypothetical protein
MVTLATVSQPQYFTKYDNSDILKFSVMWRHVVHVLTDVSEERIASIFRVQKSASEEPA